MSNDATGTWIIRPTGDATLKLKNPATGAWVISPAITMALGLANDATGGIAVAPSVDATIALLVDATGAALLGIASEHTNDSAGGITTDAFGVSGTAWNDATGVEAIGALQVSGATDLFNDATSAPAIVPSIDATLGLLVDATGAWLLGPVAVSNGLSGGPSDSMGAMLIAPTISATLGLLNAASGAGQVGAVSSALYVFNAGRIASVASETRTVTVN